MTFRCHTTNSWKPKENLFLPSWKDFDCQPLDRGIRGEISMTVFRITEGWILFLNEWKVEGIHLFEKWLRLRFSFYHIYLSRFFIYTDDQWQWQQSSSGNSDDGSVRLRLYPEECRFLQFRVSINTNECELWSCLSHRCSSFQASSIKWRNQIWSSISIFAYLRISLRVKRQKWCHCQVSWTGMRLNSSVLQTVDFATLSESSAACYLKLLIICWIWVQYMWESWVMDATCWTGQDELKMEWCERVQKLEFIWILEDSWHAT